MAHGKNHGGVGIYVIVALILGVITFVEFAMVEWPPTFMSSSWVLFWLVALSVLKFWMVIWFFMHLKDDDRVYTGFFSSGMVIAMGTFVALVFLFLLPRAVAPLVAADAVAVAGHEVDAHDQPALPIDVLDDIASDGASRSLAERSDNPRPADRSLVVVPPAASTNGFSVTLEEPSAGVAAAAEPVTDEAPAADAEPAQPEPAVADTPAEPEPTEPVLAQADADPTFDRDLGAQVYAANCSACHQINGSGLASVFPPLAGHADDLYLADGGRTYLIDVLLYGLQGPITVGGTPYNGLMPAWAQLGDEQIAAVVNHVVAGFESSPPPDGFDAITPGEVAAQRGLGLTGPAMAERRAELGLE